MRPDDATYRSALGVQIQGLTLEALQERIAEAIRTNEKVVIGNHNLNSVRLFHGDPLMRQFYEKCKWIHVDGMPLIWWARLMGHPLKRVHRVTYVDWVPRLMHDAASARWRIFYLGSEPGIAEQGAERLRTRHAGLQIRTHHGYFDTSSEATNDEICRMITEFDTNILMVGMGMPRQEHWIVQNVEDLAVNVILPAGAALDYVAGHVRTPPRWMGRAGLEWLFRLSSEPRRLWRRYLVEPWALVPWMLRDVLSAVRARAKSTSGRDEAPATEHRAGSDKTEGTGDAGSECTAVE